MTPEELNELRKSAEMVQRIGIQNAAICKHPYNGVNNASFALVNLPDLLAHIDSQAATIENLKAALEEAKLDRVNFASACQEQIDALKEKLVEERAKQFDVDEPCIGRTHFEFCELMDGSCDGYPHMWEACPRKKEKLEEARQQLKADPDLKKAGVEWE